MYFNMKSDDAQKWSQDKLSKLTKKTDTLENYIHAGIIKRAKSYYEKELKCTTNQIEISDFVNARRVTDTVVVCDNKIQDKPHPKIFEHILYNCYGSFTENYKIMNKFFQKLYDTFGPKLESTYSTKLLISRLKMLDDICESSFDIYIKHLLALETETEKDQIRTTSNLFKILKKEQGKLTDDLEVLIEKYR